MRICRRYKYMMGALNNKLSSKSRMPPMPGNNLPESFTPASRLNNDSIKSLADLKGVPGLEKMVLLQRGSRLSVQPVTAEEWKIVCQMGGVKA